MSEDKAKTVFFEKIPPHSDIKIPDQKNFVSLQDKENIEDLSKVPGMNETLRHIIPPEVRKMQSEFKEHMQNLLDQQYKTLDK